MLDANIAKIAIAYNISKDGELTAIVYNRTSEIMTIDQTKSFFVNSDGKSISYYDPTVRTTSTTNIDSHTKGATINLGSVAGALGIGGPIGQIAGGINLGGSGTSGIEAANMGRRCIGVELKDDLAEKVSEKFTPKQLVTVTVANKAKPRVNNFFFIKPLNILNYYNEF